MNDLATPAPVIARTSVEGYSKIEAGLSDLRTKYANAVFDVTSTKGMADARAARGTLRDTRLLLEKTRVEAKADALAYGRLVDSEAKRIEAAIVALEDPIAAQVKAEDDRKAAERAAKEAAERDRVAAIQKRIEWIRLRPAEVAGMGSVELFAAFLDLDNLLMLSDLYGEFLPQAIATLADTRAKLSTMVDAAKARETEAVRLKAEREAFEAEQTAARERHAAEDRERAARNAQEDAQRAATRKAEDDARAAAKAAQDAKDAAERASARAAEGAAREARQRARAALEIKADPWRALGEARTLATEYFARMWPKEAERFLRGIKRTADEAFDAREALDELDKAAG